MSARAKPLTPEERQSSTVMRKNRLADGPTMEPFTDQERIMLRGRPTLYQPMLTQAVIEDLCDGYSLGGFAGKLGIGRSTVNRWMVDHPEFGEACARAASVRQRFWESVLIHVAKTGGQGSQGQVAIFGVLNAGREDWKQRQEIEHSGTVTLAALVENSMRLIEGKSVEIPSDSESTLAPVSDDLFG